MTRRPFQFGLSSLLVLVACAALVLGAARGDAARALLVGASVIVSLGGVIVLAGLTLVFLVEGADAARRCARGLVRLPLRLRQLLFERRWSRLRPGHPSQRVRRMLGTPRNVDGFGDRVYWSYRVAGQRYTVSLDPRKLVSKYSNGLSRDLPKHRARLVALRLS